MGIAHMLTFCAICFRVTVEAVVVGRDVTNRIETRTLVILFAHLILNAPFEMCTKIFGIHRLPSAVITMVAIWTVAVFNALRRAFVIYTCLNNLRVC